MKPPKLYQPKLTEEHVVVELMQRLAYAQIRVWRVKERIPEIRNGRKFWRGRGLMGSGASTPGMPDLIGYIPAGFQNKPEAPARPLFIEVKRPGGKHRPAQEQFISDAALDGAIAFFADSWEAVKFKLDERGIVLP